MKSTTTPATNTTVKETEVAAKSIFDRESDLIKKRRIRAGDLRATDPRADGIGLALSGGGIRSATFCLGVIQAIASHRLLPRIDILSTVSGGGYAGSFLGRLFTRDWIFEPEPKKPEELAQWPSVVKEAIEARENGKPLSPVERVARVLDDHRSAPLLWLRDSGRYLAPSGAGDTLLGVAVSLRNWAALAVVMFAFVLTIFLTFDAARALAWHSADWRYGVEAWLMGKAADHLWWSPLLVLPMALFCLGLVPLGWAYWLTQRSDGIKRMLPWAGVLIVFAGAVCFLMVSISSNNISRIIGGFTFVAIPLLTVLFFFLARKRNPAVEVIRNRLSRQLAFVFKLTLLVGMLAVIHSLGQTAYALFRQRGFGAGWPEFVSATGILVLLSLVKRIKLLLDELPDRNAVQIPLSVVAWIASAVLAGAALVSISAVSHGIAWQWKNPALPPDAAHSEVVVPPGVNLANQMKGKSPADASAELPGAIAGGVPLKADEPPVVKNLATSMSVRWAGGGLLAGILLTFLFGHTLTFLNLSSHQTMYASRLTRAYHGASNPFRWSGQGQKMGEAHDGDDLPWVKYNPHEHGGPLHIVNTTLNETVSGKSQIEYRDRQGLALAVGPCGLSLGAHSHAVWKQPIIDDKKNPTEAMLETEMGEDVSGYHPFFLRGKREQLVEALQLRRWIGISGAAFTTGLGAGTSIGKSLLLGMANVRLGYWWDSKITPQQRTEAENKARKEDVRNKDELVRGNLLQGPFASLLPVQAHLCDEFLAQFRGPNSQLWYLSDGGHFENTGAYELIRRRVPYIIVCDCGCDPTYTFEDLAHLVRMARVDFSAEIEFLPPAHLPKNMRSLFGEAKDFANNVEISKGAKAGGEEGEGSSSTPSGPHALLAKVKYPDGGGESIMLVIKPSFSGDEPLDVLQYNDAYPAFPQETTFDQDFDEAQWESYRKLGRHVAEQVFPKQDPLWFTKIIPNNS